MHYQDMNILRKSSCYHVDKNYFDFKYSKKPLRAHLNYFSSFFFVSFFVLVSFFSAFAEDFFTLFFSIKKLSTTFLSFKRSLKFSNCGFPF